MNLADQLFHTLVVASLQDAQRLRPLTQSERSTMEQAEAKAGPMMEVFNAEKAKIQAEGSCPTE